MGAKERMPMFISRFLYMKAEEERREIAREKARARGREIDRAEARGRERGIAEGRAEGREIADEKARDLGVAEGIEIGKTLGGARVQEAWIGWLRRLREAERDGKPFDEPPPSF